MSSIFDGWTSKQQCFGPIVEETDDGNRYCALGWTGYWRNASVDVARRLETFKRILPLIVERFPAMEKCTSHDPRTQIVYANDVLHVPAEVFLSLDLESQNVQNVQDVHDVVVGEVR